MNAARSRLGHSLVVRLDGMGDMVICGPAIRAVAAGSERVTVLSGPDGRSIARLLPGVDDVLCWRAPWIVHDPPAVNRVDVERLVAGIQGAAVDRAVILTSFHQSALPTALLLRLAGVPLIAAVSTDYPGSLLDIRIADPTEAPEAERMLAIAEAAGFGLPPGDDGRLRLTGLPEHTEVNGTYVVVHAGASAPARRYPADRWGAVVHGLTAAGWHVVLTGGQNEAALTGALTAHAAAAGRVTDLGGRLDAAMLAALIRDAEVLVAGNTGPAHIAAAVGTPVVSLFAPTMSYTRWAPYGARVVRLGDPDAPCRDSRAWTCPVKGHPCLTSVTADAVVEAVTLLAAEETVSGYAEATA